MAKKSEKRAKTYDTKQTLVITYEQFFTLPEDSNVEEAIREGLEALRMYAGARVIGCYSFAGAAFDKENKEWADKALNRLSLPVETDICID